MDLKMSNQEMEIFFKNVLSDVYSRPKRPTTRRIRAEQKCKVEMLRKAATYGNSGLISSFFGILRKNGTFDEGTPV